MEVELKVKLRAVVEDDVQLASVEPGRPCQRPLHEVQVARVPWLERTAGANNLKIMQIRFLEKKGAIICESSDEEGGSPLLFLSQGPDLTMWSTCIEAGAPWPGSRKTRATTTTS